MVTEAAVVGLPSAGQLVPGRTSEKQLEPAPRGTSVAPGHAWCSAGLNDSAAVLEYPVCTCWHLVAGRAERETRAVAGWGRRPK